MAARLLKRLLYRPEGLLVTTFAGLIVVGTVALRLPTSHAGETIGVLDALFTATSAVCVTGLITHDTATEFSRAGQVVILVLIQLGGLGLMTFGALAFQLFRRRVSFQSHAAMQDVFFQGEMRGSLRAALGQIVLFTVLIEAAGAVLLYAGMHVDGPPRGDAFCAVFLSISAYCNAGFSVYSDSAMGLRDSNLIMWTLMALIVLGGLGFAVLFEIRQRLWRRLRRQRGGPVMWTLHARVVLAASFALVVGGAVLLLVTGLTEGETTLSSRVLNALFQSVTARTAGFNTVDIGALPVASLLVLIPLMFIGGSPGSCAGGIKTTSICVWLARVRARLTGQRDVTLGQRRIPQDVVRRAALVFALAALWNLVGVGVLTMSEHVGHHDLRLEQVIFEQVSAFGTVGLSTGITPSLSVVGKIWIILSMFAGRLGPLTIALAVLQEQSAPVFRYPEERVMIG